MQASKCQEKSVTRTASQKSKVKSDILTMTSVIYVDLSTDSEDEVKSLVSASKLFSWCQKVQLYF